MQNYSFYSVIGSNGVAVADCWRQVIRMKKYLHRVSVKGFDSFEEAESWSLMCLEDRIPFGYIPPLFLKVNDISFISHMRLDL